MKLRTLLSAFVMVTFVTGMAIAQTPAAAPAADTAKKTVPAAKPAKPAKSAVTPAQPATPATVVQPATPATAVQPATPATPAQPATSLPEVKIKPGDAIKIGAIFAVTGPASNLGAPEQKTVEMLVEQINAKGGVKGHKLVLLIKDSGTDPQKALSLAKQLIEEDKVFAIIGPSTSGETMAIKSLCDQTKTILISCAAADAIVTPLAPYVFKTPQKTSDAIKKIFGEMKVRNITKIAVLSSNTGFGKDGKTQLEKLAPEAGIQIGINEVYEKESTDLTSVLTKVKAADVQAVVNWSIEPAQAILAKNMKQLGFTIPLFQSHGFGNIRYAQEAGEAAEGILFPAGRLLIADVLPKTHPQKALLLKYKKDFETRYKEDVSTFGGHAYDAVLVLQKALQTAATINKEKVREALEKITGFVGTAGIFNMSATDHTGLGMDAFEMLTVKGGKFAVYSAK